MRLRGHKGKYLGKYWENIGKYWLGKYRLGPNLWSIYEISENKWKYWENIGKNMMLWGHKGKYLGKYLENTAKYWGKY